MYVYFCSNSSTPPSSSKRVRVRAPVSAPVEPEEDMFDDEEDVIKEVHRDEEYGTRRFSLFYHSFFGMIHHLFVCVYTELYIHSSDTRTHSFFTVYLHAF